MTKHSGTNNGETPCHTWVLMDKRRKQWHPMLVRAGSSGRPQQEVYQRRRQPLRLEGGVWWGRSSSSYSCLPWAQPKRTQKTRASRLCLTMESSRWGLEICPLTHLLCFRSLPGPGTLHLLLGQPLFCNGSSRQWLSSACAPSDFPTVACPWLPHHPILAPLNLLCVESLHSHCPG